MPELRLNLVTNEWVIIARERAKRPHDFRREKLRPSLPVYEPTCPFCPGNEALTTAETFRSPSAKEGEWRTRVVHNKFPALSVEIPEPTRLNTGIKHAMEGFGRHEVIIETPRHDQGVAQLSVEQVELLLETYQARYLACQQDPRIAQVVIFKNHGEAAGTSLIHPHSQLIATPVSSSQVRDRIRIIEDHFALYGECVLCRMLQEEIADGARLIHLNERFVALIPYAALSSFHTWIFPRRHMASFSKVEQEDISALAEILQQVLKRLYYGLNDPDFNYSIRSAPFRCDESSFHWYLSIIPRLTNTAGFELGSGMFINGTLPEESAAFLRNVTLP